MNLEVTKASEARKLVDDYMFEVTDWHIEKAMARINTEITKSASLGESDCIVYVDPLLGYAGLQDFGKVRRELVFRPIIEALRSAGYTVRVGAGYPSDGYSIVTISW
jgi:hypothetical protein